MSAAANIRLLLWVYYRSFVNGLARGDWKSRWKNAGVFFSRLLAFAAFYLIFRYALFEGAAATGENEAGITAMVLSVMHALGALLLLGAIRFAYQVFYLSADLEWLLASPVPSSRIFIAKFLENWMYSGLIVFSFGWPIALAYGAFAGAPGAYYPVALVATALLAAYSGSIGILVCLPLMRYVTAKRFRELLLTLSMVLTIGLYLVFRLAGISEQGQASVFQPGWLPTTHLGNIVRSSAAGDWSSTLNPSIAFILPGVFIAAIAYTVSLRLYLKGLQRKGEADERIRARKGEGFIYQASSLLSADIRAVIVKDALETIRSPRQWFYLIFAIAIIALQLANPGTEGAQIAQLILILFIISIFSQELTVLGISREAEMFPMIAVGGIPAWRLYTAKWLVAFIPTALFGFLVVTAMGIMRGDNLAGVAADAGIVLVGVVPLVSYSLMMGSLFPHFKAYRTRRRISPWVLMLNMFFTMILIILVVFPLGIARGFMGKQDSPLWVSLMITSFAIAASIVITSVSFTVGSYRLRKMLKDAPVTED
jgi:hypothetical protein